jgi:hypothetical protein
MRKKKSKVRGGGGAGSASGAAAVSDADIEEACWNCFLTNLRKFGRKGVRVATARPLLIAAQNGNLDVLRCLVNELGAEVNLARQE